MYGVRVLPAGGYATLFVLFFFFFFFSFSVTCSAIKKIQCDNPSSCGNIPKISYPFRLREDPQNCGDPNYELSCENNTTVLYISSLKYNVQAIDYNNRTLSVVDAGLQKNNCSVPLQSTPFELPLQSTPFGSLFQLATSEIPIFYPIYQNSIFSVTFISCDHPVNSSHYIDTSLCANNRVLHPSKGRYLYVLSMDADVSEVEDSCSIEMFGLSRNPINCEGNCSYFDIYKELVLGFELSWEDIYCQSCGGKGYCVVNEDYTEIVDCSWSSGSGSEDFGERLVYYGQIVVGLLLYIPSKLSFGNADLFIREIGSAVPIIISGYMFGWLDKGYMFGWLDKGTGYVPVIISEIFFIAALAIGHLIALKFLCGSPFVVAFLVYKWRRRHLSMYDNVEDFLRSHNNLMPIRYSFSDIKKMTKGFKDKLGEGGYGSVYKGKLRSGLVVAVKILGNKPKANGQEFINEVATIGRIHHVNVVQLIGFCAERSKRALVYDFMTNGSLDKYTFSKEGSSNLSCEKMYEIAIGVARGIEYLHRGCDMQILHFDIKPHNILLDENFTPKVSDFGLAKLYPTENSIVNLTAARGTMGYMAPELFYKNIGGISYKADVYSFGMLLMEMAGRRKNLNAFAKHTSQIYLPSWAYEQIKEEKEIEMEEATEEEKKVVKKMMITALWCIQMKPTDRPSMHKVVEMLEGEIESILMPPKPFLSPREMTENANN